MLLIKLNAWFDMLGLTCQTWQFDSLFSLKTAIMVWGEFVIEEKSCSPQLMWRLMYLRMVSWLWLYFSKRISMLKKNLNYAEPWVCVLRIYCFWLQDVKLSKNLFLFSLSVSGSQWQLVDVFLTNCVHELVSWLSGPAKFLLKVMIWIIIRYG